MRIVSTRDMLFKAQKEGFAIPAFNIHNLETIQVVVDTAAELKSPVILAGTPSTISYAGGDYIVGMASVAARRYRIPIAIHLDHFEKIDEIKYFVDLGFLLMKKMLFIRILNKREILLRKQELILWRLQLERHMDFIRVKRN